MSDELHTLRHSLGFSDDGSGREYRNYYAVYASNDDCAALAEKGDMEKIRTIRQSHDDLIYYRVTPQGRRRVMDAMPIQKMSAAKRRYRSYLAADTGMSFGEWLKALTLQQKRERGERCVI